MGPMAVWGFILMPPFFLRANVLNGAWVDSLPPTCGISRSARIAEMWRRKLRLADSLQDTQMNRVETVNEAYSGSDCAVTEQFELKRDKMA